MLVKCSFSPKRPGRLSQFLLTRSRPFVGKLAVNSITQKAETVVYLCVNRNHMSFCTFHSNNSCICNICDARGSVYKGGCSPYPRKKGSLLSSNTLMDLLSLKYKWNLHVLEQFSNDCGKYLAIVICTLCDWLKKPELGFQSMRSKTWQNQSQLVHVIFPAF